MTDSAAASKPRLLTQNAADTDDTASKNMRQLIQLRWMAVLGQLLTILVTHYGFGVELPLRQMLSVLAGLLVFNALSLLSLAFRRPVYRGELFVALLVDMGTLTYQLYLSGGATNPFVFLYLLQVGLAAVLLAGRWAWTLLVVATGCFLWLAVAGHPLALPQDLHLGLGSVYVQGMLICFILNAVLLLVFLNRITRTRRERDAHLAELRQRAAEEEHIVRMGLLASGAAHELGTPLSTIAVILGDWRYMPAFTSDPDLYQEIQEMQAQVQRCKSIVSDILLSAGETRGESSGETTVCEFLDELVAEWQAGRPVKHLNYDNHFGEDLDIASDSVLKQTLYNLLDNALEASPDWVGLEAGREGDTLRITVRDRGPGFSQEIFDRLGRPYQSTKGRAGGGLGLFLVMNVARTLGGDVQASNNPGGGAEVTLSLPLDALALKED
ncbi:HAMP domain-containing histidine kinase [Parahaliea maris]|uniref:histidine kinase n=1 Tax=Parahaliea maris TaxID=2716870 RepID=A0A5C8ZTV4_9GAMM|nr:ATP-binding protein [Parahaliea maris]TXS91229.1 HAMP domain-containing histidine kinase [Parahaliea maris]